MISARSPEEISAALTLDYRGPRGSRVVIFEPGISAPIALLLLPLDYLPGGAMRALDFPTNCTMVIWANPTRHPTQKRVMMVSHSKTTISVRRVAREMGATAEEAGVLTELIGYLLELQTQGLAKK